MRVMIFGTLRSIVGDQKQVEVDMHGDSTVGDVLGGLATAHPALRDKLAAEEAVLIFVNGRSIHFLDGLSTPLTSGDRLALFPAVGGG
jgi:molybdopterin synthase sulfur carrier subunit